MSRRSVAPVILLACLTSANLASGQTGVESSPPKDDFDFSVGAATNLRIFQRAALPGPEGAIGTSQTLAPIYQSLSMHATRLDNAAGQDSVDIQVAAWGQMTPGATENTLPTDWDVSTAFLIQRFGSNQLVLGRQVVAGGAARYSRMDGARLNANTRFGLSLSAYGGWTVLPRWNKRYGYHHLGDAHVTAPTDTSMTTQQDRRRNAMGGARLLWSNRKWATWGASFHHQSENQSLAHQSLGVNGQLTPLNNLEFNGDLVYSLVNERLSSAKVFGEWEIFDNTKAGTTLSLQGEFIHTVPALLLSQTSVFSVFSHQEVTETGGEVTSYLPLGFRVRLAAYAQLFTEGKSGYRSHVKIRFALDEKNTLVARTGLSRVDSELNGYWMARVAAHYKVTSRWTLTGDIYHYFYDTEILKSESSAFYSAHLTFNPNTTWSTRLGGSLAASPYASMDAQILANFTYSWDRRASSPL